MPLKNFFDLKTNLEKVLFLVLVVVTVALRLPNLGYSDYIQDEVASFFYWGGQKNAHMSRFDFLLNEPRGPMNVIMGSIPHAFIGNYDNTLAQRLPFALAGIAAILVFYYAIRNITKSYLTAFIAAYLLSTNGLVVAYSRVSLYESFLFLFMFSSLYFYSFLLEKSYSFRDYLKFSLVGTLMFCLAFYSHWDAVFLLIPIGVILLNYFIRKDASVKEKLLMIVSNLVLLASVLLPYYVPYAKNLFAANQENVEYAGSFVGLKGEAFSNRDEIKQFVLYNPFLAYPLYIFFGILGFIFSVKQKRPIFAIWLAVLLIFFRFFVTYSGLHFYNLFFPAVVLVAIGFVTLLKSETHLVTLTTKALLVITLFFLFIQSYLIFVDHREEYPMEREKILFWKTPKYTHKDELKHKTGFPHKRYWEEINDFVNTQNALNGEAFGYYTNEDKGIARIYMDTHVITGDYFYAIGIKRPNSFAFDYKFPQLNPKSTVHKIQNESGETVVRIYRVEERKK